MDFIVILDFPREIIPALRRSAEHGGEPVSFPLEY